jgi:hypothetical protein
VCAALAQVAPLLAAAGLPRDGSLRAVRGRRVACARRERRQLRSNTLRCCHAHRPIPRALSVRSLERCAEARRATALRPFLAMPQGFLRRHAWPAPCHRATSLARLCEQRSPTAKAMPPGAHPRRVVPVANHLTSGVCARADAPASVGTSTTAAAAKLGYEDLSGDALMLFTVNSATGRRERVPHPPRAPPRALKVHVLAARLEAFDSRGLPSSDVPPPKGWGKHGVPPPKGWGKHAWNRTMRMAWTAALTAPSG